MFSHRHSDKLIYPLLAMVILMIISYRPKYHLRPEMPDAFFSSSPSAVSAQKPIQQKQIASAYWRSALMNVQWRFAYGHPLPSEVPAEFNIDQRSLGTGAADPSVRGFYWRRLQEIWFRPEIWKKQYEWDWSWISDPIASAGQWMQDTWNRWFAIHGPR